MGAAQSSSSSSSSLESLDDDSAPSMEALQRQFSSEELRSLEHLFRSLAAQSRSGGGHVIASVFQAYFGIRGSLGSRLFELATRGNVEKSLYFRDFLAIKARLEKGTEEEMLRASYALMDLTASGHVSRTEVEAVVSSVLLTVLGSPADAPYSASPASECVPFSSISSSRIQAAPNSREAAIAAFVAAVPMSAPRAAAPAAVAAASPSAAATLASSAATVPSAASASATPADRKASPVVAANTTGHAQANGQSDTSAAVRQGGGQTLGERQMPQQQQQQQQGWQAWSAAAEEAAEAVEEELTFEGFRQWCTAVPAVKKFLRTIMAVPHSTAAAGAAGAASTAPARQAGWAGVSGLPPGRWVPILRDPDAAFQAEGEKQAQRPSPAQADDARVPSSSCSSSGGGVGVGSSSSSSSVVASGCQGRTRSSHSHGSERTRDGSNAEAAEVVHSVQQHMAAPSAAARREPSVGAAHESRHSVGEGSASTCEHSSLSSTMQEVQSGSAAPQPPSSTDASAGAMAEAAASVSKAVGPTLVDAAGAAAAEAVGPTRPACKRLLSQELAWHVAGALQEREACGVWSLAYSSADHGLSFSTFLGKCSTLPSLPGVLVVRDKGGALFGAVFFHPLERRSAFYGDLRTFLFSFLPAAHVFKAAGVSGNIQWCASGFASETIPNGVGFGGQPGHFGLFLSASDLECGNHSRACVTFASPSLSSTQTFSVDAIECWAVVPADAASAAAAATVPSAAKARGTAVGGQPSTGNTVLERFKEDRAMLGLVGIATASDNLAKDD